MSIINLIHTPTYAHCLLTAWRVPVNFGIFCPLYHKHKAQLYLKHTQCYSTQKPLIQCLPVILTYCSLYPINLEALLFVNIQKITARLGVCFRPWCVHWGLFIIMACTLEQHLVPIGSSSLLYCFRIEISSVLLGA